MSKYSREYRRQRRQEEAAQISARDHELLELMGRVRRQVSGFEGAVTPEGQARAAVSQAIDELAAVITGDGEYYHAKHQSIG